MQGSLFYWFTQGSGNWRKIHPDSLQPSRKSHTWFCSFSRGIRAVAQGWLMLFLSVFNPSWRQRHPGRREGLEFNLTTPGSLCMARDGPGLPERAGRKGWVTLTAPQSRTTAITSDELLVWITFVMNYHYTARADVPRVDFTGVRVSRNDLIPLINEPKDVVWKRGNQCLSILYRRCW